MATANRSSSALECPCCSSPLSLIAELHGRQIACTTCSSILYVSASPWLLTKLADGGAPPSRPNGRKLAVPPPGAFPQSCPRCSQELFLFPGLNRRRIRCRGCDAHLAVHTDPWSLEYLPPRAVERSIAPALAPGDGLDEGDSENLGAFGAGPATESVDVAKAEAAALEALGPAEAATNPTVMHLPAMPASPARAAPAEAALARPEADFAETGEAILPRRRPLPADDADTPHGHAQLEAARPTGGLLLNVALGVALCVALLGIGLLGWRWIGGMGSRNAESRWLPPDSVSFASLRLDSLLRSPVQNRLRRLSNMQLVEACEVFVRNAGLRPADVARVSLGESAQTSATVAVYELRMSASAEKLATRDAFRAWGRATPRESEVRGVPVFSLGRFALASPNETTVAVGETETLENSLRNRSGWLAPPVGAAVSELDMEKTFAAARSGAPPGFDARSSLSHQLLDGIEATADELNVDSILSFQRTFHMRSADAAAALRQSVDRLVQAERQSPESTEDVQMALDSLKVESNGRAVVLRLSLPEERLTEPVARVLAMFF
ncbi:MAG: hypothetical protein ACOY3P_23770 [Planctomycetota bacterium]